MGLQALAGWLAWRNYCSLPSLPLHADVSSAETVSVVVPARNEEEILSILLESLARLEYKNVDIAVVDDQSTDGTACVARACGAHVVRGSEPPPGWTGKCWACQQGADATHGDWILFTDADTIHSPLSLARALSAASDDALDILSLMPAQRCESFWERLLVPYAHALYFVGATRINKPGGPVIVNGQYLLIRRQIYVAMGGHGSVRGSLIEDVQIGRRVAHMHGKVGLFRGDLHVRVRMYRDLRSLWEGFSKNAFRFVRVSPLSGIPTMIATMAFAASISESLRTRSTGIRLALYGVPLCALLPWERNARIPAIFAALHPLAAATFQILALDSVRRTLVTRGTVWKGRRY